jgi:chromosome segregation ATPase
MAYTTLVVCLSLAITANAVNLGKGSVGAERERSLLQTYDQQLSGNTGSSKGKDTPVTRVVNLLKEMQKTLGKEQEEDEDLYKKLSCWCNNNKYEKNEASDAASSKISDLEATIEMLTARSKELKEKIAELEEDVAAGKAALAKATALREKQLEEFHNMELGDIEAIENLKAALVVLARHEGGAFPQISASFLEIQAKQEPWMERDHLSHSFDEFLDEKPAATQGFLQDTAASSGAHAQLSPADLGTVTKAIKMLQQRHSSKYYPSYNFQSGEIVGVLKQLKEEMEGELGEAQKTEAARAAAFAELRSAKTQEIESAEKMAETKEDELAKTDNDLAEAKEDLGVTQKQLAEDQKFLANLKTTCAEADANFNCARSLAWKKSRPWLRQSLS